MIQTRNQYLQFMLVMLAAWGISWGARFVMEQAVLLYGDWKPVPHLAASFPLLVTGGLTVCPAPHGDPRLHARRPVRQMATSRQRREYNQSVAPLAENRCSSAK